MWKLPLFIALLFAVNIFAQEGQILAKQLGISASSKASIQWTRVFKKDKKMAKYGIDKLNNSDKAALKTYLEDHAADSDAPEAAGM